MDAAPLTGSWKTTAIAFVAAVLNYFAQLGPNLPETGHDWLITGLSAAMFAWGLVQKDFNKSNAPAPTGTPSTVPILEKKE
jgi:hypothetical protein